MLKPLVCLGMCLHVLVAQLFQGRCQGPWTCGVHDFQLLKSFTLKLQLHRDNAHTPVMGLALRTFLYLAY